MPADARSKRCARWLLVLTAPLLLALVACGGEEPTVVFLGEFTDDERDAITGEVESARKLVRDLFGVGTADFTVYISTDLAALNGALADWPRHEPWGPRELPAAYACSGVHVRGAIFVSLETCGAGAAPGNLIAHAYFHLLRNRLGFKDDAYREWAWLASGSALYAGAHHSEAHGRATVAFWREAGILAWSASRAKGLRFPHHTDIAYSPLGANRNWFTSGVGFLAVEWLIEQEGAKALIDFFRRGGEEGAFEESFGMTLDYFSSAFEAHGRRVAPAAAGMDRGTVVGPDGAPSHVFVEAITRLDDRWVTTGAGWTNSRGEFSYPRSQGAGHALAIFVLCSADDQQLPFAGFVGPDGFVPDADGRLDNSEEAELFPGGAPLRTFTIRLPEAPAGVAERHCRPDSPPPPSLGPHRILTELTGILGKNDKVG